MRICDWCGKHKGSHRTKLTKAFRPSGKKETVLCDGCWRISKINWIDAAEKCGDLRR